MALPPQDTADLQTLFGLSAEEELMESFHCSLVQQYACLHNLFTEPHEVGLPRKLSDMITKDSTLACPLFLCQAPHVTATDTCIIPHVQSALLHSN